MTKYKSIKLGNAGFQLFSSLVQFSPTAIMASIFAFAKDVIDPDSKFDAFKDELKSLSAKGYDIYVAKVQDGLIKNVGIPEKKLVINYISICVDNNTPPTINGLKVSALADELEAKNLIECIIHACLIDSRFVQQYRLWECLTHISKLEKTVSTHKYDIAALRKQQQIIEEKLAIFSNILSLDFASYLNSITPYPIHSNSILTFTSDLIPFTGRNEEIEKLFDFCFSDNPLMWWSITGIGGSGKSRLAYEFCKKIAEHGWYSVFLPSDFFRKFYEFRDWRFPCNLLLIIDYTSFYGRQIGDFLQILWRNKTASNCKIRILFIERGEFLPDIEPSWYLEIKHYIDNEYFEDLCYNKEQKSICLSCLKNDENINVIHNYAIRQGICVGNNEVSALLKRLNQLDSQNRPLYLLLILQAWSEKAQWDSLDLYDLISNVIKKEKKRISNIAANRIIEEKCINLWSFATATRAFQLNDDQLNKTEFVKRNLINTSIMSLHEFRNKLRMICNYYDTYDATPYLPDLVGEFFVLSEFAQGNITTPLSISSFAQAAWDFAPYEYGHFLIRIISDYGNIPKFESIFKKKTGLFQRPKVRKKYEGQLTYHKQILPTQYYDSIIYIYDHLKDTNESRYKENWSDILRVYITSEGLMKSPNIVGMYTTSNKVVRINRNRNYVPSTNAFYSSALNHGDLGYVELLASIESTLSKIEYEIFFYKYISNNSIGEIAFRVGASAKFVSCSLERIIIKLREALNPHG